MATIGARALVSRDTSRRAYKLPNFTERTMRRMEEFKKNSDSVFKGQEFWLDKMMKEVNKKQPALGNKKEKVSKKDKLVKQAGLTLKESQNSSTIQYVVSKLLNEGIEDDDNIQNSGTFKTHRPKNKQKSDSQYGNHTNEGSGLSSIVFKGAQSYREGLKNLLQRQKQQDKNDKTGIELMDYNSSKVGEGQQEQNYELDRDEDEPSSIFYESDLNIDKSPNRTAHLNSRDNNTRNDGEGEEIQKIPFSKIVS